MSRESNKWLKYVLTISLAATPLVGTDSFAAGSEESCSTKILNQCDSDQTAIATQQQATIGSNMGGTYNSAAQYSNAFNTAGVQGKQAAINCANRADACEQLCKTDKDKKACKDAVQQKASDMKAQSDANSQTGGSSGMMAGLMGAAMGAALGYMMAKKQQDQQQQTPPPQPVATGALQLNGSLNCSMQDSYRYEDCNSFLQQYCHGQATAALAAAQAGTALNSTPLTGTVISQAPGVLPSTPDCASFNASYCSTTKTPVSAYGLTRSDGSVTQVNMSGTGEGIGSQYCATTVATQWCSDPVYGSQRATCPACRQMQTSQSATCAANPALCIAQNSPQQLAAVTAGTACSGDPLYTPGSPYALPGVTGTTTSLVAGQTATTGNGLPVVVLPSSTSATGTSAVATTTTSGGLPVAVLPSGTSTVNNGSGGIAVTSVKSGTREGRAVAGTAGASGSGFQPSSAHVGQSELIAAGGVIVASGPSGVSRGPASDVDAKFSPSLFATSSNVIHLHCQAGKLNNCP